MKDLNFSNLYISIIVPIYNYNRNVSKFLKSLMEQNFNRNQYEIIMVDNGSTDNTVNTLKKYAVKVILEHDHLNSPYSARNRGIERAKGNVIVLLDSTCIPIKTWLTEGIRCLKKEHADIIGGNLIFRYDGKKTAAKVLDAITNVKMKNSIEERKIAKTGNLFIRREVFNTIGLFPEGIRSGGDVRWTRRAVRAGFKMVFCEAASVSYPAKPLVNLIKKQWRVGLGQPEIWLQEIEENYNFIYVLKKFLSKLVLLHIIKPKKEAKPLKGIILKEEKNIFRLKVLVIGLLINIIMIMANYIGIFNLKRINHD